MVMITNQMNCAGIRPKARPTKMSWSGDSRRPTRAIPLPWGQHVHQPAPQEHGADGGDDGGNADLGDDQAVDHAGDQPDQQAADNGQGEAVGRDENGAENPGRDAQDRREREVHFAEGHHIGHGNRHQPEKRHGRHERAVDREIGEDHGVADQEDRIEDDQNAQDADLEFVLTDEFQGVLGRHLDARTRRGVVFGVHCRVPV